MSVYPPALPTVRPAVRSAFEQGSGGGAASIIAGLFASGQQGFWLPFTDFASLTQDSAGTLPYTAVEQPVGRVLDRSGRGNHASQVTSTARGVVSARVNLLTKTEQFVDAAWNPTNITPTLGQSGISGVAPVAVRLTPTTANGVHGFKAAFVSGRNGATHSVYIKADGYSKVGFKESSTSGWFAAFDLSSATLLASSLGSLPTIQSLDGGWCRISFSPVTVNAGQSFDIRVLSPAYTSGDTNASTFVGDGVSGVLMCGPQMEDGLTATTYQRVNTPTDYDAIGFPKYLRLDGTDDFYTCNGGGSTTGFYYSDVVMPTTSTFSALLDDTTAGGGYLVQRTNTGIYFSANAGAAITSVSLPLAANVQAFVLAMDDGVNLTLQVNGAEASIARPVVTAGSSTMYLGRYTSVAQYFSGTMTEPIYRAGPPPSAYERDVIRGYQMQKAGML